MVVPSFKSDWLTEVFIEDACICLRPIPFQCHSSFDPYLNFLFVSNIKISLFNFFFLYICIFVNLAIRCHPIDIHYLWCPNWVCYVNCILISCLNFWNNHAMDLTEGRQLFILSSSMWSELQIFIFIVLHFSFFFPSISAESVSTSSHPRPCLRTLSLMICGLGYQDLSVQSEDCRLFFFCVWRTRVLPRYRFQKYCNRSNGKVLFKTPAALLILTEAKAPS